MRPRMWLSLPFSVSAMGLCKYSLLGMKPFTAGIILLNPYMLKRGKHRIPGILETQAATGIFQLSELRHMKSPSGRWYDISISRLMLPGVLHGTGVITLLTGIRGARSSGILITDIITTGITIITVITAPSTIIGITGIKTFIMAASGPIPRR